MNIKRIRALTLSDYYLPGYRAGGALRTVVNMVEQLSDHIDFIIITRNNDLGSYSDYKHTRPDQWNLVDKVNVFYLLKGWHSFLRLRYLLCKTSHDVLYLNSLFSVRFSILPLLLRLFGLIPTKPLILAPRGELSQSALSVKLPKKRLFLYLARIFGLHKNVIWQAASNIEKKDIQYWFPRARIQVAQDMPGKVPTLNDIRNEKRSGLLYVVFISRISRTKNLDDALRIISKIHGHLYFDIYGPKEDQSYWVECEELIKQLPKNIEVRYKGIIPHEEVHKVFSRAHLFLFPTRGESYGHVIYESLLAGCPVLISNKTPWRNLSQLGAGWDVQLGHIDTFVEILQRCIDMKQEEFNKLSNTAREFGMATGSDNNIKDENILLFSQAIDSAGGQT